MTTDARELGEGPTELEAPVTDGEVGAVAPTTPDVADETWLGGMDLPGMDTDDDTE